MCFPRIRGKGAHRSPQVRPGVAHRDSSERRAPHDLAPEGEGRGGHQGRLHGTPAPAAPGPRVPSLSPRQLMDEIPQEVQGQPHHPYRAIRGPMTDGDRQLGARSPEGRRVA